MQQKEAQSHNQAVPGGQSALLGQQAQGPTQRPEDPSPCVWTQDSPRTVLQTISRFASMPSGLRRAQDSPIAQDFVETQIFLASGNLFFTSQEDPCYVVLLGAQTIPDNKIHGQSPLSCKVSSSVYLCYLFIDTGYARHGHCHWNF